jgi:hypothetical protein
MVIVMIAVAVQGAAQAAEVVVVAYNPLENAYDTDTQIE